MSRRRVRLTLGYRGTRYAGWAVQSRVRRPTVQATVEAALAQALGEPVRTVAAGRTDAGVHADGQVISFDTASSISPDGLLSVLPRWLPDDVWAIDAENVAPDFDARHSARRRWYRYALWRSGIPSADWQGRCLIEPQRLDLGSMREAASALLGRHDFGSFITKASVRGFTERTVFAADWLVISESLHVFEICADAFLKQMVRTIVGSLLWVGNGRWTGDRFATTLSSTDRRAAGPNAPAVGLTLHRIDY